MHPPPADLDTVRAHIAHTRAALAQRAIDLRAPPAEPATCCGRGCNGCVWEGFYAAVGWWQEDAGVLLAGAGQEPG